MNKLEINKIKKACSISDKIFKILIKELKNNKFKTESDVYNFLLKKIKEKKCNLAFKPIVATGKNAADIHHKSTNAKLKNGFLKIDFGVKYQGYCSDCTRTFHIGKPDKKSKELYKLVLDVQQTCINYCHHGMSCNDIDAIARAGFGKYRKNFVHGLGHGVGKRIHQAPSLAPNKRGNLKEGVVIAVEPGIYFKNKFGIRIEDNILITKQAPIILTRTTKKLVII